MTTINKTNAPASADPRVRAAAIVALREKGDRYGHAAIAGLAHELALRFNGTTFEKDAQKSLAESTGYDKGNLSRVAKIIRTDATARRAALKLDVMTIDSTPELLAAAVKVGLKFKRVTAVKTAPSTSAASAEQTEEVGTTNSVDTAGESTDVLALVWNWLREATPEQFAGRLASLEDAVATIASERAAEETAA